MTGADRREPPATAAPAGQPALVPFEPDALAAVSESRDTSDLDIALVRAGRTIPPDAAHRAAAVRAVTELALAAGRPEPAPPDPATLTGRQVSRRDLLGQLVDQATGQLRLTEQMDFFSGVGDQRVLAATGPDGGQPPDAQAGPYDDWLTGRPVWLVPHPSGALPGLSNIFPAGPCPDSAEAAARIRRFDALVRTVLGGLPDGVEAWQWRTTWSTYFDDGEPGWESACWTVRRDDAHVVVVAWAWTD